MRSSKIFFGAALLTLAIPGAASAACTRADLTGTWRTYALLPLGPGRCTLVMPASGTAISASSSCYVPAAGTLPITGSLAITTACQVTGSVTVGGKKYLFNAWISRGKDSIAGMGWEQANPSDGYPFAGSKQ